MSHPISPTYLGMNRTGIASSPLDSRAMVEASEETGPAVLLSNPLLDVRQEVSSRAPPVGTMPLPASVKGAVKQGVEMLKGRGPTVILDKLGERLAYERTGVRLYEALIAKLEASDRTDRIGLRARLEEIREDELQHLHWVREAIEELGADPTVMTPSADVIAVASQGMIQAITDPRTTFTQGLEVILGAELLDHECWGLLIQLAREAGRDAMAKQFRIALQNEEMHLHDVRELLFSAIHRRGEATPAGVPTS